MINKKKLKDYILTKMQLKQFLEKMGYKGGYCFSSTSVINATNIHKVKDILGVKPDVFLLDEYQSTDEEKRQVQEYLNEFSIKDK